MRWEEVEQALSSRGRLRILRELAKHSEDALTKYGLERSTGLMPVELRRQLKILLKLGWVEELPYTPRKYQLNLKKEFVKNLTSLLRTVSR